MDKLLVIGIDTLIGSNLALALSEHCEVLGLARRQPPIDRSGRDPNCWSGDHAELLESTVASWQPQWIVHCGPLSSASWDQSAGDAGHSEPALVTRLAEVSRRFGCRLTVISSDTVFRGPRMFHDEASAATNPQPRADDARNLEAAALAHDALVVRTCAYGWSADPANPGFAEQAFDALRERTAPAGHLLDGRRHATPILATDLAQLLWRTYECHLRGLYHVAGTERTSPRRFVSELAAVLGVAIAERTDEAPFSAQDAEETSLCSKHARRALATSTPMLREGLERFVAQADSDWRDRLRGAAQGRVLQPVAA